MTVCDILSQWLKANGYDGLIDQSGECGCKIDDLVPCSEYFAHCLPAYRGCGDDERDWAMYRTKEARDKAAQEPA